VNAALDHVFVCCSVGAPEADTLAGLGLKEGSRNTHPGQGTACRRFFFQNAYLELLWVSDPREAQSKTVRPTRLWDRWFNRGEAACPFGIVLRPAAEAADCDPPFPTWAYRPSYLPPQIAIEIARDTPLSEPEFFYLGFQRGRARPGQEPVTHAVPASELTGVRIWGLTSGPRSPAATAVQAAGLVTLDKADHYLMELTFDGGSHAGSADLRPDLPLILRW
jgi:Glyoxalase-like domain